MTSRGTNIVPRPTHWSATHQVSFIGRNQKWFVCHDIILWVEWQLRKLGNIPQAKQRLPRHTEDLSFSFLRSILKCLQASTLKTAKAQLCCLLPHRMVSCAWTKLISTLLQVRDSSLRRPSYRLRCIAERWPASRESIYAVRECGRLSRNTNLLTADGARVQESLNCVTRELAQWLAPHCFELRVNALVAFTWTNWVQTKLCCW